MPIQNVNPTLHDANTAKIYGTATNQLLNAQSAFPSITGLASTIPTLNIPGLSPTEMDLINQLVAAGQNNPDRAAAEQMLSELTSGPIGSSPATAAGMKAFEQQIAPQVKQMQALQGTAGGGAALEAMAEASSAAALPLIQQEIQNREAAVGQYSQLGMQQIQQLAASLEAAGMPREVAQQQAQAQYDAAMQQWQYETGVQTYPLNLMGRMVGQRQDSTMTGMDWIAGAGKGLSVGGLLGLS
jgi:hypothetical protein